MLSACRGLTPNCAAGWSLWAEDVAAAETAFEDGLVDLSHDFIRGTHTPYASPGAPLRVQIRSALFIRNRRGVATLHGQLVE